MNVEDKDTQEETNEGQEQQRPTRVRRYSKPRRHWYDHEKIAIVAAFDRGHLKNPPGRPRFVIDPKTGSALPITLIEAWKSHFLRHGLLKPNQVVAPKTQPKAPKPAPQPPKEMPNGSDVNMAFDLMVEIIANRVLKRIK